MTPIAPSSDPPGPRTTLAGRLLRILRFDPIKLFTEMSGYGEIAHTRFGHVNIYLFNDPELIRSVLVTNARNFIKNRSLRNARALLGDGLLTSEGDFHRRQRRLAAPAFHQQRIERYAAVMVDAAERTTARWRPGQTVDMPQEMMHLTLGVAGKALFDANVEDEADQIGAALNIAMGLFVRSTSIAGPLLERLPLPSNRRYRQALDTLDTAVYRMIADHRANPNPDDLLGMLIGAQEGADAMSDRQLRDEAMTIFLAGHETTALATTWTWYLLAQHPEVEEALHRELRQVLGNRSPGYADLPALRYTRMVFAEALRLYPPAYVIGREALGEFQAGGYTIPAGSTIFMSQYVMHRNPRFYPDPERFDPLRWTPEAEAGRPKFAYFPFGGGPRVCIGEGFAWTEGVLILAALARTWRPRLLPGFQARLEPMVTLRPRGGIPMRLERW